jgi:hypothetical protein
VSDMHGHATLEHQIEGSERGLLQSIFDCNSFHLIAFLLPTLALRHSFVMRYFRAHSVLGFWIPALAFPAK